MSNPIADIWMFESVINTAVATVLLAAGINDPKKQQSKDGLTTPRVEIKTVWNGFPTEHYWLNQSTKEKWPDTGSGTVFLKIVTRRGSQGQDHYRLVGTVRGILQDVRTLSTAMTLHRVEKMLEAGSVPDFKQDEFQDVTALSFQTIVSILFESKQNTIFPA